MKRRAIKALLVLISIFLFSIGNLSFAEAAITFLSQYDTDGIAATNPQWTEHVPSYQIGSNHVFFAAVAVHVEGAAEGTQGTLTIWNSETTMTFTSTVETGGYTGFVISAPYTAEGYYYRVEVAGQVSETRRIAIAPQVSGRYEGVKINWDTTDLNINSFPVTITAQAYPNYSITSATLSLGLGEYPVTVKGEVTGSTITFNLEDIPDGEYTAVVVAETDMGIISSEPRRVVVGAGIQAPELKQGQSVIALQRISDTEIEAAYLTTEIINREETPGEKLELIDHSTDPLIDVYTFRITLDSTKTQVFTFSAYNDKGEVIYSEEKELSFRANTPEEISFILPKGDPEKVPEDIAYVELKGSLVEWKQGKGLQLLGITIPNAVSIDLGATGSAGQFISGGGTFGTELVINFHSGEISTFIYRGPGGGISPPLPTPVTGAGHGSIGLISNLEKNKDYEGWSYQAGGEIAVGYKGVNAEIFVPMKDGLPDLDGYSGVRFGWSGGLMASIGVTAVKSNLENTWTFSEFLQNPIRVIGEILGIIPVGSPGGDHPDDFAGVVFSGLLNQSYDWSRLKGIAFQKNLQVLVEYIEYKELIAEKQEYLDTLPAGSTPDENYLNGLESGFSRNILN